MTDTALQELRTTRQEIIEEASRLFAGSDSILLPTTPCIAPPISTLEISDEAYFEANGTMLRNTSIINFIDGCALSIPCHRTGEPPAGIMVAGCRFQDTRIFETGLAVEAALRNAGRNT